MKLKVDAQDLLRIITTAIHGLPNKPIQPEHGLIRLVAETGKLTVMCGDGNFNVEAWCQAEVDIGGACLCKPDEFHSAALLEKQNTVAISTRTRPKTDLDVAGRLSFKGLSKASLRIQGDFDFPRLDIGEPAGHVVFEKGQIKSLKVAGDITNSSDSYALNVSVSHGWATTFNKHAGMGTFVKVEDTGAEAFIPLSYLERASKAIDVSTYNLFMRENGSCSIQCTSEQACCSFVTADGSPLYPKPYIEAVPKHSLFFATSISKVLKAAQVFADASIGHPCKIKYDSGEVSFKAVQAESDIVTPSMPVRVEGEDVPFSITFRITYLKMAADDMKSEFWMNFCSRGNDVMYVQFEKDQVKHVFMPLVTKAIKQQEDSDD